MVRPCNRHLRLAAAWAAVVVLRAGPWGDSSAQTLCGQSCQAGRCRSSTTSAKSQGVEPESYTRYTEAPIPDCPPPDLSFSFSVRRSLARPSQKASQEALKVSELDGARPSQKDEESYFHHYGTLAEQMTMLEDKTRTDAYERAILGNPECFKDKVVLDIGCGTGVLSMFAARAGARKVYAIEASNMAWTARMLVKKNGFDNIIEVIQGLAESVVLPEQVDTIVSEWMGNLLLKESMLDTVLFARDRFLRPDGAMFPSHATLLLAPCTHSCFEQRLDQYISDYWAWQQFADTMLSKYKLDYGSAATQYEIESSENHLQSWDWHNLNSSEILGPSVEVLHLDLMRVTRDEVAELDKEILRCQLPITTPGTANGLCGSFEVQFRGSELHPAQDVVTLSTRPGDNSTHWGQQLFGLFPEEVELNAPPELGFVVQSGDAISCELRISRPEHNLRTLRLDANVTHLARGVAQKSWQGGWFV